MSDRATGGPGTPTVLGGPVGSAGDSAVSGALTASFSRRRGQADQVHVTRGDRSTTSWRFPSYGDVLPHDLVHFVVEEGLGLTDGFWGLVDQGADVILEGDQAVLTRDGLPLTEHRDVDFTGLTRAEEAVALLGPQPRLEQPGRLIVARPAPGSFTAPDLADAARRLGFRLPPTATADTIAAIHTRLRDLAHRWNARDGEAITLTWHRCDVDRGHDGQRAGQPSCGGGKLGP
ncbi:hypothetical protein FraEuI1c_1522 [Pseudofrankia inefficax]|uniref:Uncharacterized protein n=1 Tax=Pseudofrankia inefficax (strain DSM 45817 / CECT 9037 / DDB 130130 / EuI1c) TaxID=298654 RepID=E3J7H5_PSEI1|nr:hypothetical protein FraEuI1c_1522 [Pseudofrankia inefficax]